jgi:predicted SAM-dependent methyltransferase
MKLLNLGCGNRFHPDWVNVDSHPADPSVMAHDMRRGLPFGDGEFAAVYHSHTLEHFRKADAPAFLVECRRVLEPGGVIRVVVPDLERIARTYIRALDAALEGDEAWQRNYEWVMLQLYDQTVREFSGGEMGRVLAQDPVPNREFIVESLGTEAHRIIEAVARARDDPAPPPAERPSLRERAIRRLLGPEYPLLQVGRFRDQGEVHFWMYDRYSLARLLTECGFSDPQVVSATESRIPGWAGYDLDTTPGGTVHKPDSLFMEAVRPER